MSEKLKKALVMGGGAAGLAAALELAKGGASVDIVEKTGFLGGYGIQYGCKASPDCVMCGACAVEKLLKEVGEEPNIRVILNSRVASVGAGSPVAVSVKTRIAKIDPAKCSDCGDCFKKYGSEGAVLRGYSHNNKPFYALADNVSVDPKVCGTGAIAKGEGETEEIILADTIVAATGFSPFDARIKSTYGYGVFPNVTTGLEVERQRRALGGVFRDDGSTPKKVAFIQCVGSRDERLGNPWCSQVCCAYALRIGQTVKNKDAEAEITVFYMDIQSVGKGFSAFYEKCRTDFRFIRNIPVDVFPEPEGRLRLMWSGEEDGVRVEDIFDMLVLSVGITPGADSEEVSKSLGIGRNADGFLEASGAAPKVFVAGTAGGPGNIAASMAEGGRAALEALKYMKEAK